MNSNCETLIRQFRDPSGEYMPLLMWFWNDYITEDEITFRWRKCVSRISSIFSSFFTNSSVSEKSVSNIHFLAETLSTILILRLFFIFPENGDRPPFSAAHRRWPPSPES